MGLISKLWRKHPWALASVAAAIILAVVAWRFVWPNLGWPDLEPWWARHRSYLEAGVWVVDVLAFVFAVRFLFHLREITESLSTRFIGRFPDDLDVITDLVCDANRCIDVLWDGVDPGSYFDPQAHEKLLDAVLTKANRKPVKVDVKYLVWGGPKAISAASGSQDADLDAETARHFCEFHRARSGFTAHLDRMFQGIATGNGTEASIKIKTTNTSDAVITVSKEEVRKCLEDKQPDPKTAAFKALQLCLHEWVKWRLVDAGATVSDAANLNEYLVPEIFFWIIDGREAVFAFPCPGQRALAFRTRDSKLVGTLEDIFNSRLPSK